MTEKMIEALEAKGFKRWQKAGYDRLYVNATQIGLNYTTYKTGNISWAEFNGEEISNNHASKLIAAKTYIDVNTGDVVSSEYLLRETVKEILESLAEELENENTETAQEDTMNKETTVINANKEAIEETMADCYRSVIEAYGETQYKVYIWEDGEIVTLYDVQGSNTWLQPRRNEDRELYYLATISAPGFDPWDLSLDAAPDDDDERAKVEAEIIDYAVEEWKSETLPAIMREIINRANEEV